MSEVELEKGYIKIDLQVLFDRMSEEDQKEFIYSLSLQKDIIENVCDYLAGDDRNGCWSGYDDEWRLRALRRIEKKQLKNWSRYNWDFFKEATARLKEIREKQHLYWALHHGPFRDELSDVWFKFCKENDITSEYTTKKADEDIARVEAIVEEALSKMAVEKDDLPPYVGG